MSGALEEKQGLGGCPGGWLWDGAAPRPPCCVNFPCLAMRSDPQPNLGGCPLRGTCWDVSRGIRSILRGGFCCFRALRGAFLSSPVSAPEPSPQPSSVLAISGWRLVLGTQGPEGFSA